MRLYHRLLAVGVFFGTITLSGCAGTIRQHLPGRTWSQPCNLNLPQTVPLPPYMQEVQFYCLHEYRNPKDSTDVRVIFYYQPVAGMDYQPDGQLKFSPLKRHCYFDENLPPNTFGWFQKAGQPTHWSTITVYFNAKNIGDAEPGLIHPPTKDWLKTFPRVPE